QDHDHRDQPHVVGFPDRTDRAFDQPPLGLGARPAREEIPHTAAEVSTREERVERERDHHHAREDRGERQHPPPSTSAPAPLVASATWCRRSTSTIAARKTYTAV